MTVQNLETAFSKITEPFSPVAVYSGNGITGQVIKIKGIFHWHRHDSADEFYVVRSGKFTIHYLDKEVHLGPEDFHVVPKGTVHRGSSEEGAEVLFFGPDDWIEVDSD